eukprot:3123022-Rhodomonas_salina.5
MGLQSLSRKSHPLPLSSVLWEELPTHWDPQQCPGPSWKPSSPGRCLSGSLLFSDAQASKRFVIEPCAMLPLGVFGAFDAPYPMPCRVQHHSVSSQREYALLKGHLRRSVRPRIDVADHGRNPACTALEGRCPPLDLCVRDRAGRSGAGGGSVQFGLPKLPLSLSGSHPGN